MIIIHISVFSLISNANKIVCCCFLLGLSGKSCIKYSVLTLIQKTVLLSHHQFFFFESLKTNSHLKYVGIPGEMVE